MGVIPKSKKVRKASSRPVNGQTTSLRMSGAKKAEYYVDTLLKQKGRCAICGISASKLSKKLTIDHCHNTGILRGLLCMSCNTGLGFFCDDVSLLQKAQAYLRKRGLQYSREAI